MRTRTGIQKWLSVRTAFTIAGTLNSASGNPPLRQVRTGKPGRQKYSLRANWISRSVVAVLVIWPKLVSVAAEHQGRRAAPG